MCCPRLVSQGTIFTQHPRRTEASPATLTARRTPDLSRSVCRPSPTQRSWHTVVGRDTASDAVGRGPRRKYGPFSWDNDGLRLICSIGLDKDFQGSDGTQFPSFLRNTLENRALVYKAHTMCVLRSPALCTTATIHPLNQPALPGLSVYCPRLCPSPSLSSRSLSLPHLLTSTLALANTSLPFPI